jgi:cysteine desulfurase
MQAADLTVFGADVARLPGVLCFAAEGFAAERQVMAMDLDGVMVSAGAACSSGKVKPSRVIEAMGRLDLAPCAIRISGGWATSATDWARCGEAWTEIFARHQARRRAMADA